jgi:electron transport complex protein RnfC
LAYCGGVGEDCVRLLMGGPMMGQPLPGMHVPVIKGTNGILALTAAEVGEMRPSSPCIRCGRCVEACPMGLLPVEMANLARREEWTSLQALGLSDCMACGSCAYVCPSRIPLPQYFAFAHGKLAAQRREERKAEQIRLLMDQRQARFAREEQAKAEAAAQRRAAKKQHAVAVEDDD